MWRYGEKLIMSKTAISGNSNRTKLFINMKEETAKRKKNAEAGERTVVFRYYSKLITIEQGTGTAFTF